MRRNLNGGLAVELAGGLVENIVARSRFSLEDGRRDKVEEMSEPEGCWNRGVRAVAEALVTRAVAEGVGGSPGGNPFATAEKMPNISLKTPDGSSSAVTVVGVDSPEEDSIEREVMFVAIELDISPK